MTNSTQTTLIIGATSGTGLALAQKLAQLNHKVIAIGRTQKHVEEARANNPTITFEQADSSNDGIAAELLSKYIPDVIVLAGGTNPVMATLANMSWDQFSQTWNNDTKMAFQWTQALLTSESAQPKLFISMSSGASLFGSPLSGGYAGAKRMQTFLNQYGHREASLTNQAITFITALPKQMMQGTAIAQDGSKAYSQAMNKTPEQFMAQWDKPLTPSLAAEQLVTIINECPPSGTVYALTGNGLEKMD